MPAEYFDTQAAILDPHVIDARDKFGPGAIESDEFVSKQQPATGGPFLNVIEPTTWHGQPVPPRCWTVLNLVPRGTVTMVNGEGAAGKSTLILQLAVARALGIAWLGIAVEPGRTLYLSAEDDAAELHRRIDAIRRHYDAHFEDMAALTLVDLVGHDAVLGCLNRQTSGSRLTFESDFGFPFVANSASQGDAQGHHRRGHERAPGRA